jgi:PAS domain S-box-containing protein
MTHVKAPGHTSPTGGPFTEADTGSIRASVLMVDDQASRLLTYEAILSGLDVSCVWALSGTEALEQLLKEEFAVILLDVNMPEMNGFDLAKMIREHPRLEKTPIIFITGVNVSEMDRLQGYQVGAIDYISVPVVPEILRTKVAVLVELHQRRHELRQVNRELAQARARLESEYASAIALKDAQLRAVFEHPSDLTIVLRAERDATGTIRDWSYREANTNALQLLGIDRETLLRKRMSEVIVDRAARASEQCARVLESGVPERYESHYNGRDFLITLFTIGDDCVVSSGVDITDRKRAESARRESDQRYKALIEHAPVGVAHNTVSGRFEYANDAFCALVGYTLDELRTKTWQEITHPDDLAADLTLGQRVLEKKLPFYTTEKRYLRKDGTAVWVEMFGNFVMDDQGQPLQGVAVAVDITARRNGDAALRASEERFRELANSIDQFAWSCDRLGHGTWYNDRWYEYTGTTFEQMRGDGWASVMHPDHLTRVVAGLERSMATGEPWEDTFPLRGRKGQYRWFLSRAVPFHDQHGNVVRWFGTNTDVTEQRELQEALRDTDRRKDEFLAMLAHELRNPVAPISNAAEVLLRRFADDSETQPLVEIIRRQSMNLARLLDDLLDVARITQGRVELRPEVVPLITCIQQAVETAEPMIRERSHHLSMTGTFERMDVHADRVRLAQCISNILINAAKYTNPGGDIQLQAYADAGEAVVEIRDTGIGISSQLLPKVFDLFVQSERPLDRTQGGLGIGLAVCKQLIEMHGGTVEARSPGVGLGSTFSIRLPLAAPPVEHGAPSASAVPPRQRLLVVDDNQDSADSLAMLLEIDGHDVRAVYSATSALEEVDAFAPDMILLDIGLPDMDGYEVARRVLTRPRPPRLVAVSGYGQLEDRQRSANAGFAAHLVKPVDMAALKRVLASDV